MWLARASSELRLVALLVLLALASSSCRRDAAHGGQNEPATPQAAKAPAQPALPARRPAIFVPPPVGMIEPVAVWEHGQHTRYVEASAAADENLLVLDIGENWTPYLFTDGVDRQGKPLPNAYRPTYLALARAEFPNDQHGERAKVDKYLELFGVLPTLSVLRARMIETARRPCAETLDLVPMQAFRGLVTYSDNTAAKRAAALFGANEAATQEWMREQGVIAPEALDLSRLPKTAVDTVTSYMQALPQWRALEALQKRLQCEGFLSGKGKFIPGVMDWATHSALAEFERRHAIFSLGYMGKDSLAALRRAPLDVERDGVLRLLTERAMHTAGVLEDGSTSWLTDGDARDAKAPPAPRTFTGSDGAQHPIPDLAAQLRDNIIEAFGLESAETTLAWLASLGELPSDEHRYVAVRMPQLPEYYAAQMELTLDYDRGDVWYDFPYDDKGKQVPQPVSRRPQVTVSALYNGQKIPLARFGTTIGGWRSELIDGQVMWKYKESPVGERAWDEIVSAPVWMPPDSTPPEDLLRRNPLRTSPSDPEYVVKYPETGPGYASAYGLVAAYHRTFARRADGRIVLGRDEGIRTHGSVDYMSIMRRHSHGCHRLHNHMALRLMSFVLAHRPHERVGQEPISYARFLTHKGQTYRMELKQGGYVWKLTPPLIVNVETGRIRGTQQTPIEIGIPRYDPEHRAYMMRDGTAVKVRGDQLIPVPVPPPLPVVAEKGRGALPTGKSTAGKTKGVADANRGATASGSPGVATVAVPAVRPAGGATTPKSALAR